MEGKVVVGTRFFEKNPERKMVIENFVRQALTCIDKIFVAVNIEADMIGTLNNEKLKSPGVEVFGVTPWSKFVPALNALIIKAKTAGADFLLLASAEIILIPEYLSQLQANMDGHTLVVGAALEGHDLKEGEAEGNGRTVPWNTLSLWNLEYLSRIGFPLIGDALFDDGKSAGVEEVGTITLLQNLYPFLTAKLIEIPGMEWKTDDFDVERLGKHQQKMRSKVQRPAAQMEILNLPPPKIIHIRAQKN